MIVRITRVKVGNRQAPQQQTETPPRKRWGFCVYASGNESNKPLQHQPSKLASLKRQLYQPACRQRTRPEQIEIKPLGAQARYTEVIING